MFEYIFMIEKSYETKLKMSPFCGEWPSVCWTILKLNRMIKIDSKNNIIFEPWVIDKKRQLWIIFIISILAILIVIRILRRWRYNVSALHRK